MLQSSFGGERFSSQSALDGVWEGEPPNEAAETFANKLKIVNFGLFLPPPTVAESDQTSGTNPHLKMCRASATDLMIPEQRLV